MPTTITSFVNAEGWERALDAFLAEKERRSGSLRTVQGFSRMLRHIFGSLGMPPDRVAGPDVLAWAYGTRLSGRPPSQVTIRARIACLSSFFRFLTWMGSYPDGRDRGQPCARTPRDAGERIRVALPGPLSLAATTVYLPRLDPQEDKSWRSAPRPSDGAKSQS
jgi:hypothetical protein